MTSAYVEGTKLSSS